LNQDNDDLADDQILMNKYNKLHPGEIYIDNKTEIFLTIIKPLQSIKKYTRIENNIVYESITKLMKTLKLNKYHTMKVIINNPNKYIIN
jgi:hypothetical protein